MSATSEPDKGTEAPPIGSTQAAPTGELLTVDRATVQKVLHGLFEHAHVTPQILTEEGRTMARGLEADVLEDYLTGYRGVGFGVLGLAKHEDKRFTFHGFDLMERQEKSRTTTCHLTLGFLSGAVSASHEDASTLGTETRCQSRGDPECEFVIRVSGKESTMMKRVRELI